MSYHTTLHVSWKLNYGGLKFIFEETFCVLHVRNELFLIFNRLYLMTHVLSGGGKGIILLSFDSSFMWCEQFYPGRTFIDDFYFIVKP